MIYRKLWFAHLWLVVMSKRKGELTLASSYGSMDPKKGFLVGVIQVSCTYSCNPKKKCGQKLNAWFTQRFVFPENGWQPEVYNRRSSFSRAKSDSWDHEVCPASGQTCSEKPAEGSDWKWGFPESNRSDYHISQIRGVHGFRVHHKLRRGKMLKDVKWAWSLDATKSWAAVSWLKKHPNPCLSNRTHNVRMFQALSGHYSIVLLPNSKAWAHQHGETNATLPLHLAEREYQLITTCPLHSGALLLSCCS